MRSHISFSTPSVWYLPCIAAHGIAMIDVNALSISLPTELTVLSAGNLDCSTDSLPACAFSNQFGKSANASAASWKS
jgi:hypothetical protein